MLARGGAILIGSGARTYVYIKSRKNTIGPKMKNFPLCLSHCVCVCARDGTHPILKPTCDVRNSNLAYTKTNL